MREIKIRNKFFNVTNTHQDFWNHYEAETWEKSTFDIFDRFINVDTCFFDIGSWMGPTALYAAQTAKKVICIEADPVAFQELQDNIALNPSLGSKITIINKAISSTQDNVRMGARTAQGDSMSSALFSSDTNYWEVEAVTPQQLVDKTKNEYSNYFTKIDIEGGEYNLMPHLQSLIDVRNNTFFISLHPKFIEKNSFIRFFKTAYLTQKALLPFKGYKVSLVRNETVDYSFWVSQLVAWGVCYLPIKSGLLLHNPKQ